MEGKSRLSIILLVIIAALAIALASITVYVLVGGAKDTKETTKTVQITRPADSELSVKKIFEKKLLNLKAGDDKKTSVIQISTEIVYFNKVTGVKDIEAKLTSYDGEIKELIGTYFQNLTLEEVKKPETKEKAKKDLTLKINELLNSNQKTKNDIIYNLNFDEWFYQ